LRDRKKDIPLLAEYYLHQFAAKTNMPGRKMSKEFLNHLQKHSWKGNIRELRNTIQRALILADKDEILPTELPYQLQKADSHGVHSLSLANVEKDHIAKVLVHTKGNKTRAAELLGIGLTTLYRKMEEYNITSVKN